MPLFRLRKEIAFPPPHLAEDGLLAIGGDLRPERLLLAYQMGIFPWYSEGEPLLWWSPDPRFIMPLDTYHPPRRLLRTLRQDTFQFTFDHDFAAVITACAHTPRPDQDGTWITDEMIAAYKRLHKLGYAHSLEAWQEGRLAGGLYGVSIGAAFFGESMFTHVPNASKAAFAGLIAHLRAWSFQLLDCQVHTPHLEIQGACEIPRTAFLERLATALQHPTRTGPWTFEPERLRILSSTATT